MKSMEAILLFVVLTLCANVHAYVNKNPADQRYPTQAAIEQQVITTPLLAVTTRLVSAGASSGAATAKTFTTFVAQPDVPRNITITTGGTTADIAAGNVVVTGTNFFGATITETIAIADDLNGTATGSKAFKTVTSVLTPAQEGGFLATWSVGIGSKLGLKRCMDYAGYLVFGTVNGAYETTRPTMAVSATAIESNTATMSTALNGAKDVGLFFIQNFRCKP